MSLTNLIKDLETEFLQPEVRKSKERLNELLADNFYEIGESGSQYKKQDILNDLPKQTGEKYTIYNFNTVEISSGIVMATYLAEKEMASSNKKTFSLRTSLWQKRKEKWQIIFHQRTPLDESIKKYSSLNLERL
jgi:hypothetical protein